MGELLSFDPTDRLLDTTTTVSGIGPEDVATPAYSEATLTSVSHTLEPGFLENDRSSSKFTAPLIQILTKYESLTLQLFTAFEITAEGRTPERSMAQILREIIELDKKLMQGINKGRFKLLYLSFL